jgi:hypothetical protein
LVPLKVNRVKSFNLKETSAWKKERNLSMEKIKNTHHAHYASEVFFVGKKSLSSIAQM